MASEQPLKLPLRTTSLGNIQDADGETVILHRAGIGNAAEIEAAEHFVRCVNAHDKLVELVEGILRMVQGMARIGIDFESPEVLEQRGKYESDIKQVLELAKGNEDGK